MTVCLGLFIVWWGWIGFNAGSSYGITGGKWESAARAGAGTTLASMAAGAVSILFSIKKHSGKVDVYEVISGILSALGEILSYVHLASIKVNIDSHFCLVAINAGCFMFSMYSSALVGVIAAILGLIVGPMIDKM